MMYAYAVRQTGTDKFLPQSRSGHKTALNLKHKKDALPRIFLRKIDAHNARLWWKKGKAVTKTMYSNGGWGGQVEDVFVESTKVPGRDKINLEIVKVSLEIIGAA